MKGRVRILLMLMTFLMVISPAASAQTDSDAPAADDSQVVVDGSPAAGDEAAGDGAAGDGTVEGDAGEGSPDGLPEAPAEGDAPEGDGVTPAEGDAPEGDGVTPAEGDVPQGEGMAPASSGTESRQADPGIGVMSSHTGTITVNVVGSDAAHPVPTGAFVCVSVVWNCANWTGAPLTFTVPAGEYAVSFDQFDESYYTDKVVVVTIAEGDAIDLTITLEPRQPSTLRLYVSTDTGVPLPAGTQVCIQQDATPYTDAIDECQPVALFAVDFTVNEGWVDIQVVTPLGSGFGGASDTIWVPGGTTYRDYLLVVDDVDAHVTIDVATEDGVNLTSSPVICFQHATTSLEQCRWEGSPVFDGDGGGNFTFQVPAGTWVWVVEPTLDTQYLPISGTITVADGDNVTIEAMLPLRTAADVATVDVQVMTFTGVLPPDGTEVCVSDVVETQCQTVTGDILTFQVAAGWVSVSVTPPEGSGFWAYSMTFPLVLSGETLRVDAVLYPDDLPLTLEKWVSDAAPEAGDEVTFTIHAYGPAYEFDITDWLPAELTDVTVTCEGSFWSELPGGACYERVGNVVVVPGISGNGEFIDIVLRVTGTVTGEPGTEVTNLACVTSYHWMGNEEACDSAALVIAETVVDPTPSPTPDPGETPVPVKTPTPKADSTPDAKTVTKLPSTGQGDGSATSAALYALLASVVMLGGAGLLRFRGVTRR